MQEKQTLGSLPTDLGRGMIFPGLICHQHSLVGTLECESLVLCPDFCDPQKINRSRSQCKLIRAVYSDLSRLTAEAVAEGAEGKRADVEQHRVLYISGQFHIIIQFNC